MRKSTIWAISIIMGVSFVILLCLQLSYIDSMVKMKKEQFDESVNRSLYQAVRHLELHETIEYLEKDVSRNQDSSLINPPAIKDSNIKMSQAHMLSEYRPDPKEVFEKTSKKMREVVKKRYINQKELLDEVVYSILYTASDKPLKDRINFKLLDQDIRSELLNNGVKIPYHFTVTTADGRVVYHCPDYVADGKDNIYSQVLFQNDPQSKMGMLNVHFPDMNQYLFSSVRFMIPSLVFTFVLLITFIFTIYVIFRQKKLSEMRNDFINNMTHELKTPISSISLAAQMLSDEDVAKSEHLMNHASKVILDESKRLRMLVDKVLQMSLFDKKQATFKKKDLDINELVETVVDTFRLKVEYAGGKLNYEIGATDSVVLADEMHFTNVIFNLMDNAVKYKKDNVPLNLMVKTWNDKEHLYLSVADNGMGIKKDDLKKVFEKFYRVHTGNVHNVKGFGLGLAYVKKIVTEHEGNITVESELGKGTKFIISMPLLPDLIESED